jgi:hypothetical protein
MVEESQNGGRATGNLATSTIGNCSITQRYTLGPAQAQEGPMTTVWIYVETRHHVGHPGHLNVFANADAPETWLEENAPEGVAFEYEVLE